MPRNEKLVLLDAHALIHRAYHALPPLTTKKGQLVNAVYGFALVLLKILKELKPDYLIAAFDRPEPTFRHKEFKEYKAQRPKAEPELISQFELTRKLVEAFSIPVYEKAGYEADDVIATIVAKTKNQKPKTKTIVVSGDLDLLQLVSDSVEVLTLKKGVSETMLYDQEAVQKRFGLKPEQLSDFKALKGDPSDNIPGLSGIGDKTASVLLQEYGDLGNLYKNLKKIKKPKIREVLEKNKEQVLLNKRLVTLQDNIDLDFKKIPAGEFNKEKVIDFFKELGFYSLINRIQNQNSLFFETATADSESEVFSLAAWLLNPGQRDYLVEKLLLQYSAKNHNELKEILEKKLKEEELWDVYTKIELPLIPVLRQMEQNGIRVNQEKLKKLSSECGRELTEKEKEIYELAGVRFNINSSAQLSRVLFEHLKIPIRGLRKTPKGVISTQASELKKLSANHNIISLILKYRELLKLKTTYLDALPKFINPKTSRIQTVFLQTATATGRLASENPNLQNIPLHGSWGSKVREIFIAEKGYYLVSFDYSQLELRLAAHLSEDPKMLMAFRQGLDIHSLTAAEINNIRLSEVTPQLRQQAKTLNFGVLYGMGAQGLAEAASISRERAENFIKEYFIDFSRLSNWIENIKLEARLNGFVKTLTGRRRYLPEIHSSNFQLRSAAERMAVNMPIQGLAADIIKIAMVKIYESLVSEEKLLLQIHDELLFEMRKDIMRKAAPSIKKIMENAFSISIPLEVKVSVGLNWGQLSELKL